MESYPTARRKTKKHENGMETKRSTCSLSWLLSALSVFSAVNSSLAHPVPRRCHDRTIVVWLTRDRVVVEYRLEVDEFTVVYDDLPVFSDKVDLSALTSPDQFYEAFTRCYGPVLADNLIATVEQKPVTFRCVKGQHRLHDEKGVRLDHLRCDFRFEADWKPSRAEDHAFQFRDGTYELQAGMVRLSLASQPPVEITRKKEPSRELQQKPARDLKPGEDALLRSASATFVIPEDSLPARPDLVKPLPSPATSARGVEEKGAEPPGPPAQEGQPHSSLLALLLDPGQGIWMLLLLATFLGAVHALTPGHGKTLVAAYLVGQQGTVWHALVLGLVTTLTHTGIVLLLAGVLFVLYPDTVPEDVKTVLGLVGGLLVAGMGFWLLLRRLSGGADHIHLGGHGHHHHHHDHSHADHTHDEQGHIHSLSTPPGQGGWWGLVILGMNGGIVPCWEAIIMLGFAISAHRLWLALPLLVAFSAGLAGVLIALGILVVKVKGFAASRLGNGRLLQALPILSAALVTVLGLWLCYDSVH